MPTGPEGPVAPAGIDPSPSDESDPAPAEEPDGEPMVPPIVAEGPTEQAELCLVVSEQVLLDFEDSGSDSAQALFGDFVDTSITLIINTAGNDVSPSWRLLNGQSPDPSFGRCTPAQSEFDGTYAPAHIAIALEPESREVVVPFAELGDGGREVMVKTSEITKIAWSLPGRGLDAEPYAVDVHIDDIRFVAAP
jgi:hypothetical protein